MRIGLRDAEGVGAADRIEALRQTNRLEQTHRQPLQFVGADCESAADAGESGEGGFDPRVWLRTLGDVACIVRDEITNQPIELGLWRHAPMGLEAAFDQYTHATSDHIARRLV